MRTIDITPIPNTRSDGLSHTQRMFISQAVAYRKVIDLGGANGELALWMAKCGADSVLVVDKEESFRPRRHARIFYHKCYFQDAHSLLNRQEFDVGVISWPVNYMESMVTLIPVLIRLPMLIYIGSNKGVNQCGTPELWRYLTCRRLIFAEEREPSSVLIYGDHGRDTEEIPLQPEELAGLNPPGGA